MHRDGENLLLSEKEGTGGDEQPEAHAPEMADVRCCQTPPRGMRRSPADNNITEPMKKYITMGTFCGRGLPKTTRKPGQQADPDH